MPIKFKEFMETIKSSNNHKYPQNVSKKVTFQGV